MRVTVDRIAKQAGVSRALASSVLSGGIPEIRFSEETRLRVQKAAKALNYKRKAVNGIGLIHSMGTMDPKKVSWAHWLGPMLESIQAEAVTSNKLVSVFGDSYSKISKLFKGANGPEILKRRKVDGLIISGVFDGNLTEEIGKLGLPYVLMNVDNSNIHDTDAVFFDDLFAGRQATEYLIRRGHRRILHVTPKHSHEHYSIRHRQRGYEDAMREAELEPFIICEKFEDDVDGIKPGFFQAIQNTLEGKNPPTAIFAYNENLTFGCHRVLEKMNLTRRDVNLITIGTSYSHLMKLWGIPQVEMPAYEVGQQAYQMLMKKQNNEVSLPSVALRGSIRD